MSTTEIHAEHSVTEHEHGTNCGHEAVQHDDHYDSHESVAEHTRDIHTHGTDCGHESVEHDGHVDYLHDGHKHAEHGSYYDEH